MGVFLTVDEAMKARAWQAFAHDFQRSLEEIAATELGVSPSAFAEMRRRWRWPPRLDLKAAARREQARRLQGLDPRLSGAVPLAALAADDGAACELAALSDEASLPSDAPPSQRTNDGPVDLAAVADRLAHTVRAQLDALHAAEAADPDRMARTLASLVKTLSAADALARQGGRHAADPASAASERAGEPAADDEPAPRSLEELRQELARRLERLVEDEDLERGFSFPDPEGVGNPD